MHGYGIIKAVEEMSEGRVRLRAGTLYGALERLESQGYVAFHGEGSDGGPARRYYRLTTEGQSLLASEASVWLNPVIFPPGCGRLATKPEPTGSETIANTIGMVRVSR